MASNGLQTGKRKHALHRFYFVRPKANANADELAQKLISLRPVEEVWLTDGDFGFVVKARFFNGKEPKDVSGYIEKNVGARFGRVISYCQYSK